ncbi:hypothetical protein TNCV_3181071 [Trichonephila clavipes]|nr:hypothetical protein TNCV_3181071 [Trichonephila clavipes]
MDKPQTLDHLEDNIRRVIADIRPQMLEKVIENWTSRLDYIRASRGSPMPEIIFKMKADLAAARRVNVIDHTSRKKLDIDMHVSFAEWRLAKNGFFGSRLLGGYEGVKDNYTSNSEIPVLFKSVGEAYKSDFECSRRFNSRT